jgi:DNA repair protein RadA/Sms
MAKKPRSVYVCQACGAPAPRWFGRCPGCGEWNTCAEEQPRPDDTHRARSDSVAVATLRPIGELAAETHERLRTSSAEFDRALGGGIMPGSVVLVGGDPGIGKSTLLLQMAGQVAAAGLGVAYVSAEESGAQIAQRGRRLGAVTDDLLVMAETNLTTILDEVRRAQPAVLIIDSIQTIYLPELESAPGTVTQVRECAARLVCLAKETDVPVFLVGHVTKEGSVAGPRVLEHLVDTVLYLEGDRHHHFRVLRAAKNRYGSTHEIGLFEMGDAGLSGVANPSQILLAERAEGIPGSAIVCSLEGTRPLLVEIQALAAHSSFGYPQRVATGIDAKRLSILIAVLEKRGGHDLSGDDVFVNVVGGIRLDDPAVDLGVALAILSSSMNRPLDPKTVAIAELGLGGEVRPVSQVERRVREARSLGFERCLVARSNMQGWKRPEGMEVVGVGGLQAARELTLD